MNEPLSPAAQAIDDAARDAWAAQMDDPRAIAAVTLRTAADQTEDLMGDTHHPKFAEGVEAAGSFLKRIATELESPMPECLPNIPLSPAAQAAKDHFLANAAISLEHGLAAAFFATMEHLLPLPPYEIDQGMTSKEWCDANRATLNARQKVAAIICELRASNEAVDNKSGPWRPIPAPQAGPPWQAGEPAPEGKAPATISAADRLALVVCGATRPVGGLCPVEQICKDCRRQSAAVAHEIARQLRERHGGSSQVADWLDGVGCYPATADPITCPD